MSKVLDWQVTFTFRPLRTLQWMLLAAPLLIVCLAPSPVSHTSAVPYSPPPKTYAQLSQENAVRVVGAIIDTRMAYLDRDRRDQLAHTIVDESMSCNLDPLFALAVGDVESNMDHEAVSATGARGMFQVMPSTWDAEVRRRGLGRLEKFNVVHNARVGIGYLCYLGTTFKRPDSLLLAYNQGPSGAMGILNNTIEPSEEASTYGPKVWKSYRALLGARWLPNDLRSMRQLARNPDATIYTPFRDYGGDGHGPEARPLVRVKGWKRPLPETLDRAAPAHIQTPLLVMAWVPRSWP